MSPLCLAAYIRIFGRDAQMQLIARISELERRHEFLLAALPPAFQQQFHARHKQAAAEPGLNVRTAEHVAFA